jgi:hypothetical protein
MDLDCTCFRVKRLSRLITQLYDAAVRPAGLRITQPSLLAASLNAGPMTVSALAKGLGADTTSISRALVAVAARGLVVLEDGADTRRDSSAAPVRLHDWQPQHQSVRDRTCVLPSADWPRAPRAQDRARP